MHKEFDYCELCPRICRVNRNLGRKGYCGYDSGYHIASVFVHKGEEPPIKGLNGICNIFFRGCNMRCSYCQNYQISRKNAGSKPVSRDWLIGEIISCLEHGVEAVGFVSPTHFVPHVKEIIALIGQNGYKPVYVYNTNAYDRVEVLKELEGLIDVYLPDFKYMSNSSALKYSDAEDYPEIAKKAIREMYRQKGSTLIVNENGQAISGMIIRHLVLPGHSSDSVKILEWIASELSPSVAISLMSQYYPTVCVAGDPTLGRYITKEEYDEVLSAMERLCFYKGWIQDFESSDGYRPDFNRTRPFED